MPRLLSQRQVQIEWTDIEARQHRPIPITPRSNGIHLSGVLRYIAIKSGILQVAVQEDREDEMPLRMALGMAWENWVVGLYPDMIWQPGEFERDQVYGTPDGITLTGDTGNGVALEEFKCTWKSSRKPLLDQWMWMQQGSGYCNMLDTDRVTYNVLYVNGDYRDSGPQYIRSLVEFSSHDLRRNWDMVLGSRDAAGVVRE